MMNAEEIQQDFPINMRAEVDFAQIHEKLPHMRYLMNNEEVFDLTVMVLLKGIKLSSMGSSEKEKSKNMFKQVLTEFLQYQKFEEIQRKSLDLNDLEE